jgi:hypothetical protein
MSQMFRMNSCLTARYRCDDSVVYVHAYIHTYIHTYIYIYIYIYMAMGIDSDEPDVQDEFSDIGAMTL